MNRSPRSSHWRALLWVAVALWIVAVGVAVAVIVAIVRGPDAGPGAESRAIAIAASAFISFAIPAAALTVGALVVRRQSSSASDRPSPRR